MLKIFPYISIFYFLFVNFAFAETLTLKSNTIVVVKSTEEVTTQKYKPGQEVIFSVGADVKVKGKVVIESGAKVIGIVQSSEEEQMAGVAGKISVAVQVVETIDGQDIPISGQYFYEGDSEVGGTVAVGVLLCPLVLLNKGKPGTIPAGAQIRALTVGTTEVEI